MIRDNIPHRVNYLPLLQLVLYNLNLILGFWRNCAIMLQFSGVDKLRLQTNM